MQQAESLVTFWRLATADFSIHSGIGWSSSLPPCLAQSAPTKQFSTEFQRRLHDITSTRHTEVLQKISNAVILAFLLLYPFYKELHVSIEDVICRAPAWPYFAQTFSIPSHLFKNIVTLYQSSLINPVHMAHRMMYLPSMKQCRPIR
jgi:hypothetical protein